MKAREWLFIVENLVLPSLLSMWDKTAYLSSSATSTWTALWMLLIWGWGRLRGLKQPQGTSNKWICLQIWVPIIICPFLRKEIAHKICWLEFRNHCIEKLKSMAVSLWDQCYQFVINLSAIEAFRYKGWNFRLFLFYWFLAINIFIVF